MGLLVDPFNSDIYHSHSMNNILISFVAVVLVGCAGPSGPTKAELWDAKIGTYTYAEAVGEYGPPDNKETLDGGVLVASWVSTRRSESKSRPVKNLYTGEVMYHRTTGGGVKVKKTILTFDADKKLQAWRLRTD